MRTPVILVAGQHGTDEAVETLLFKEGTVAVGYHLDGHVVVREITSGHEGVTARKAALELAHGCVSCTIRNDLLVLLRRLHQRGNVERIVVQLPDWLEPQPICWAIDNVRVHVGPGYVDGPAGRDATVVAVVTCVNATMWLPQALGDDELDDGRTIAQVVVGQAESADALVVFDPDRTALAVLRRLAPRARITAGTDRLEQALAHLDDGARRGRGHDPHAPLLAGQPCLRAEGPVAMIDFQARRPFHPQRLHAALDVLLDGVIRAHGRLWLANQGERVVWLESAGGGLHISSAGKWLAAMTAAEAARISPERHAFADLIWDHRYGDRHSSLAILVCGADTDRIRGTLTAALLTDDELRRPNRWPHYPDPFGDYHQEPCDESSTAVADLSRHRTRDGDQP
ncbi:ribosome hibernation factor-recruiting GTPase MRF [[Mycobacterium] nativiensis]|uniref:GTP-binding protein n=1 Tax=[Mycobacterium] nativiensis TaxID=2855503 RepID=A0ABU5XVB2_9MYCO|nr:GTP-binding protein [Mycolicibacter sp. MYC340]MEB3031718.1 GTP-binding protein [Mycolicibacter sp. MYC340]